jgi:hypothetical protein
MYKAALYVATNANAYSDPRCDSAPTPTQTPTPTPTVSPTPTHHSERARGSRSKAAAACRARPFTLSINLTALGNENTVGFSLNFDPAVLSYQSSAKGSRRDFDPEE